MLDKSIHKDQSLVERRNNSCIVSMVDRTKTNSFKLQQELFKLLIKGRKYFLMVSEAQEFPG